MKYLLITASFLHLTLSKTAGELCQGTANRASDGNWYCSEVMAITYRNISQPGTYNRTTTIDPEKGLCSHERVRYPGTGPLTPLFGELSMHLRGPMNVSRLAVYQAPREAWKLKRRSTVALHDGVREQSHLVDSLNGLNQQNTTHVNLRLPPPSTLETRTSVTEISQSLPADLVHPRSSCIYNSPMVHNRGERKLIAAATTSPLPFQNSATAPDKVHMAAAGASWGRVAHYTSTAPAEATGFAFLANKGDPQKSGTFDYAFGNSLSYVIGDGSKVASASTPFDGMLKTSEVEIAVLSDKQCDGDCEYWRPDSTAHYGWAGESKAFLIEFQMDHYDNIGSDQGLLSDAPAWWFLNAAIPRILQYGNDRNNIPCSCWSTGCGEFDAFEVLGRGEERAKSTMHRQGNLEGGDSNYFKRPVGRKLKFGVFFYNYNITARVLDDGFDFGDSLTEGQIQDLVAYQPDSWVHSLFSVGD